MSTNQQPNPTSHPAWEDGIYTEVDGFYYFDPHGLSGAYAAHTLRDIADALDAKNLQWNTVIESEFAEGNPGNLWNGVCVYYNGSWWASRTLGYGVALLKCASVAEAMRISSGVSVEQMAKKMGMGIKRWEQIEAGAKMTAKQKARMEEVLGNSVRLAVLQLAVGGGLTK